LSSDTKLGWTPAKEGLSVNICCGESLAEREPFDDARDAGIASGEFVDEFIVVPEGPTLVLTVCVLPLNMDNSSLASSGFEGLKMSFGISTTPLLASR